MNSQTIEIVKSTAPVLKEHSKAIGKRFYQLLFASHPELYNLFNQTNQRRGIQQEALAHSVYASGENLDHLEAIRPIITRIAHKHRAIGIVPEQYPIVGENLLQAVKEVLGDQVNDEIMGAWEETYEYLADVFIRIEKELYEQAESQPGGWRGFREFVVDRKVKESDVITSFYLKPADGKAIASYQPGQYLTLRARIPGEKYDHIRHYSLSDKPNDDYYRISVKREDAHDDIPAGIVSNYLHHQIAEGDHLSFSAPAGDFTVDLDNQDPLILISGGVGLTPLMSMFNTVAEQQPNRPMTFIHAAINGKVHAMREHVAQVSDQNPHIDSYVCYEQPTEKDRQEKRFDKEGFIDRPWLESILTQTDGVYYVCGPIPFMNVVIRALKEMGIPQERIHFEAFSPISVLDAQKDEVHS
ncbi:MAG: NO-inducible flavohemoprotein [Firmicutes bacterium]|uniref:Flavohemoprotein n=1 Tax=Melghirimyces thermohalophilus TaxID=1236220 RepID=A0A1G6PM19_9BACL|nr:NO-inducible flavohemoprotein [Melghirimyces thermohalophilus]MDA8351654.1 NO-inducible flavohemoprotein [Bacillota bacterium]SDC81109.1 nitric oxide dioxygenase [Melghirimyces thermohalophilus]